MDVSVKLFGPAARAAGASEVTVHLTADTATVRDVLTALGDQHPLLTAHAATARLAVNHEFASDDTAVGAGDELALIAQVSGG